MVATAQTYELLTGKTLFQKTQSSSGVAADADLLLQQYALTGETLNKDLVDRSPVKGDYFDDNGDLKYPRAAVHSMTDTTGPLLTEGSSAQTKTTPYSWQTLKERLIERLTQHSDLSDIEVDAAADFIQACFCLFTAQRSTPAIDSLLASCWSIVGLGTYSGLRSGWGPHRDCDQSES